MGAIYQQEKKIRDYEDKRAQRARELGEGNEVILEWDDIIEHEKRVLAQLEKQPPAPPETTYPEHIQTQLDRLTRRAERGDRFNDALQLLMDELRNNQREANYDLHHLREYGADQATIDHALDLALRTGASWQSNK